MASRVAVAQMDCTLGDVDANLRKIRKLTKDAVDQGAGLVIFPELCTTGYFVADKLSQLAEPVPGPTTDTLVQIAKDHDAWLVVGMAEAGDDGKHYNVSVLVSPGGLVGCYRKVHLFDSEKAAYALGDQQALFDTPFGKVALTICYDLLFPEYIRSLVLAGADLVINSTNWITDDFQRDVWGWNGKNTLALAATRALENTVHVAMAARVGQELHFTSVGHSCVARPSGDVSALITTEEGVAVADVVTKSADLDRWRSIATYLKDRRTDLYSRWGV